MEIYVHFVYWVFYDFHQTLAFEYVNLFLFRKRSKMSALHSHSVWHGPGAQSGFE